MSTTSTLSDGKYAAFIAEVADHAAAAEVTTLFDYYGAGTLVVRHGRDRDAVKSDLMDAYKLRGVATSTVNVYLSQGISLATTFDTFGAVETFADETCKGSRSLKRIYDASRVKDEPTTDATAEGEGEGEAESGVVTLSMADVIIANLANVTDEGDLSRIADALNARIIAVRQLPAAA